MAMNIAKLQAQLQHVPDQSLIGYVQNPDGQVPSYLALAELTRRKEIRKSAAPQQAAPTQTVAQQAVAETQPGIAELPLRDEQMFSEQSYASGGIVAFDEGGEVSKFTPGGLTDDDIAYQRALAETGDLGEGWRRFGAFGKDVFGLPGQLAWTRDPKTGKLVRAYEAEGWMPRSAAADVSEAGHKAGRQRYLDSAAADNVTRANLTGSPVKLSPTATGINQVVSGAMNPVDVSSSYLPTQGQRQSPNATGYIPPASTAQVPPLASTTVARPSTNAVAPGFREVTYTDMPFDAAGFENLKEAPVSAIDERNRFKELVGANQGLVGLQERLKGMETKAKGEEERAPWMALAKAGLGMAGGKSQFAIQNIAEGAQAGLADLVSAKDKLAAAEEKRFGLQAQLAQAQRAEELAAAKFGEDSAQHIKAQNRATDLAAITAKSNIDVANKTNRLKAEADNAKNSIDAQQVAVTAGHYADWRDVMKDSNLKSIATMDKAEKQQQTALLSAGLRDIDAQLKDPNLMLDKNRMSQLQQERNAVNARLYELTGVTYKPQLPSGGGTLGAPSKGGIRDYIPGGR